MTCSMTAGNAPVSSGVQGSVDVSRVDQADHAAAEERQLRVRCSETTTDCVDAVAEEGEQLARRERAELRRSRSQPVDAIAAPLG